MSLPAAGAAFVDRSGVVIAADPVFLARLGVDGADPAGALRSRVEASPALRALLAGEGPAVASVPGADGPVELERVASATGLLLVLRDPLAGERIEHALRSQVLGRLLAGVAHDIKNPLNAMSLQLALLGDKLDGAGEATQAAAGHLGAMREQIGRVNEVLRRLVESTDPSAPLGYTDVGALAIDLAFLFGYDARRRRVDLAVEAVPGGARTPCDPSRVGRLIVALFGRALARTPESGRFRARAATRGREAILEIEHTAGDPDGDVGYETEVLTAGAAALGGRFERAQLDGATERLTLAMPGNERE